MPARPSESRIPVPQVYRSDAGLFFRSIHGSWVHVMLAEQVWHGRITGSDVSRLSKFWSCDAGDVRCTGPDCGACVVALFSLLCLPRGAGAGRRLRRT